MHSPFRFPFTLAPHKASLPVLLSALSLLGCDVVHGSGHSIEEARDVSDFDNIALQSSGDVKFVQSDEPQLSIEGEDNIIKELVTTVEHGSLVVKTRSSVVLDPTLPITIRVEGPNLSGVSIQGSGSFDCETLDSDTFALAVSGSGSSHTGRGSAPPGSLETKIIFTRIT